LLALAILANLVGLIVLLCVIPIDFAFRYDSSGSPSFTFQIGWFFSLIKISPRERKAKAMEPRIPVKRKSKKRLFNIQYLRLMDKPLVLRTFCLVRDMLHCLHFKSVNAELKAGLGEPAESGMLFGLITCFLPIVPRTYLEQISIVPDFGDEPVLEGSAAGYIRLWPVEIIGVVLMFAISRPFIRMMRRRFCHV
jgi:hypothetical protein